MSRLTITVLLICGELITGGLLGRFYINQYSFLTSEQSLGQFFVTVIWIYSATVFLLGTVNLRLIGKLEMKITVRCVTTSLVLAIMFALPILFLPHVIVDNLDFWGLSPFVVILLGLVVGFNFQILKSYFASIEDWKGRDFY